VQYFKRLWLKCRSQGSHASWKLLDFGVKIYRPWKVLENGLILESPGNFFCAMSWKVLEFFIQRCGRRTRCRCRCQKLQKLAQILSLYMYEKNRWPHSNCCLSLYLNVAGIRHDGCWINASGVLEKSWKFL